MSKPLPTIADIIRFLEILAPPALQEDYDNCGLLIGDGDKECSGVLISLDCTPRIVEEALKRGCNLVVSHHPLIFRGLKQINGETVTGQAAIAAIRGDLSVYAIHTNLDNVADGVCGAMADRLGLAERQLLIPRSSPESRPLMSAGSGLVGNLPETISEHQFLKGLQSRFGTPVIRHSALRGKPVSRVALCGGAGSFMIVNALANKADFFVTADVRYHEFFEPAGKMVLADIGHFESEQFTADLLHDAILKKFPNFAVLKAGTTTNPVHYYL